MTLPRPADERPLPETIEPMAHIRLYIAGGTPNSLRAQHNLLIALAELAKTATQSHLEVIDVFQGPKRAIVDGILVTPTLLAQFPDKRVMMVGDLSDAAALGSFLLAALAAEC